MEKYIRFKNNINLWYKEMDEYGLTKEEQELEREKSWDRIFNIEPFENDWILRGKYVQAVFWELKLEYVITVLEAEAADILGFKDFLFIQP